MVDVVAPLRSEPLFDILRLADGSIAASTTIRFATYLDDIANNLNAVVISEPIGDLSEVQQAQSFTSELSKRDDEIDQMASLLGNANARITEMQKQIDELEELVE